VELCGCTARRYKGELRKETETGRMSRTCRYPESKREGVVSPISVLGALWPVEHKNRGVVVGQGGGRMREGRMREGVGCRERAS